MKKRPHAHKNQPENRPNIACQIELFTQRHFWLLLGAVLLIAVLVRTADLRADPPPDLSWSFAPYTDESLNTYSARNFVLYGNWHQDDFLPFCIYPLVNILVALIFKLLGIGFVQVKLLSVSSGVLGVLIMALLIRHTAREIAALLAGLFLALSYPLVMYSRLGLVETVQTLFLLLTGFFWVKSLGKPILMLLSGFFAFTTFLLIKISAVFILPVLLLLFINRGLSVRSRPEERRRFLVSLGWFTAGAVGAILIWLIAVFLPYRNQYLQYVLRHSSESPAGHPQTLLAYLFNTFTIGVRSRLLPRLVWIALLGFLSLPVHATRQTEPEAKQSSQFLLFWFIFGVLMLGYMNYRPPRYEIVILPPLIAAAAITISQWLLPQKNSTPPWAGKDKTQGPSQDARTRTQTKSPLSFLNSILYAIYLWPLVVQLLLYIAGFRNYPAPGNESSITILALIIALATGITGTALYRFFTTKKLGTMRPLKLFIAALLLLFSLRLDLSQFFNWFSNRTYILISSAHDLDQILPANAVVAGSWAPPLMIESRKRAIAITDWANINDPINRFGVTHIIIGENEVDQLLWDKIPLTLKERMRPLRQYRIRGQLLTVYTLS